MTEWTAEELYELRWDDYCAEQDAARRDAYYETHHNDDEDDDDDEDEEGGELYDDTPAEV